MSDQSIESVYLYTPNKGAAIFFTVAFASSGLFQVWQCYRYRCFRLTGLLPLCCALLTAASATRAYGAVHENDAQVYTASILLVYMSPPVLILANFCILGRLFCFVPYFASMHPARMVLTFATATAIIEVLGIMGVAYLANRDLPEKSTRMGDVMTKASLICQLFIIAMLLLMVGIFHHCCRTARTNPSKVTRPLTVLYTTTTLVLIRTVYRIVEHFTTPANPSHLQPSDSLSPMVLHEWYFYVFDTSPMLLSLLLWNVFHPLRYLPADSRRYLAQDGKTELKGPGWKDPSGGSLTETFMNPFAALTKRVGHQKPFWERNGYELRGRGRRGGKVTRRGGGRGVE